MTNADKYLKDGVDIGEFANEILEAYMKGSNNESVFVTTTRFLKSEVKPTLTEDEKAILRNIDKKYKVILRQHNNIWIMEDNDGEKIYHGYCLDYYESNLFKFIEERRRI